MDKNKVHLLLHNQKSIDQITAHEANGEVYVIDMRQLNLSHDFLSRLEHIKFLFVNYIGGGFDIFYPCKSGNELHTLFAPKL
ncbi:hypothetical protein E9993_09565 [Labilibacter sediminis]|nr:hypothetical protein E9993_09565 [Labilibacter sediminis]